MAKLDRLFFTGEYPNLTSGFVGKKKKGGVLVFTLLSSKPGIFNTEYDPSLEEEKLKVRRYVSTPLSSVVKGKQVIKT